MIGRVVLTLCALGCAVAPAALADAPAAPIPGCGSVVVLETGFPQASEQGEANIATHVPVACAAN